MIAFSLPGIQYGLFNLDGRTTIPPQRCEHDLGHRTTTFLAQLDRFLAIDQLLLELLDDTVDERSGDYARATQSDPTFKSKDGQSERAQGDRIHHPTTIVEHLQEISSGYFPCAVLSRSDGGRRSGIVADVRTRSRKRCDARIVCSDTLCRANRAWRLRRLTCIGAVGRSRRISVCGGRGRIGIPPIALVVLSHPRRYQSAEHQRQAP